MTTADAHDPATEIIVVSGLPRSGTSMMMRMLEAGGLELLTDGARQPDQDNPGGYFELENVKRLGRGDDGWLAEAGGKVVKIVSPLLRFLPDAHRYAIVFMHRKMDEVLASQRLMLAHRGEPTDRTSDERLAELYAHDLHEIGQQLAGRARVRQVDVSYNVLLSEPRDELHRVAAFLARDLDVDAMAAVVDPQLYRQRR